MKKIKTIQLFFAVFFLTVLCSLTTLQAQTNLVTNPGFEVVTDGIPDNWTNLSPSTLTIQSATDVVNAGSKSLKVISTYGFDFVINYVPITPGKTYNLSVWYNIQSYTGSRSGVSLAYTYIDADGNNLNNGGQIAGGAITSGSVVGSTTVIKANTVTLQTWGQLTLTTNEVVPSTAAYIGILLRPNQITAYFDNASVTEVGAVSKQDQTISGLSNLDKTVGNTDFNLSATATSGLAVSYSSSNTAVATISDNTVHIVGAGTTTITASQAGNDTYNAATPVTATLTVNTASVAVTGVTLKTTLAFTAGNSESLIATVAPDNATNKNVSWASDNSAVATVDNAGKVIAVAAGTATITVTTTDGSKTATCAVTVTAATVAVTGVTLNKSTMTLIAGGSEILIANLAPESATNKNVTWSSDNTAVATVDNTGKVSALTVGSANIIATTTDGDKKDSCAVTVTPPISSIFGSDVTDNIALTIAGNPIQGNQATFIFDEAGKGAILRVFDFTGKLLIQQAIVIGATTTTLFVENLKTGIYLVNYTDNTGKHATVKMIK